MSRRGVVLVLVLLVVLALELLAVSAFSFARIAGLGARHTLTRARLDIAAEDAAVAALVGLDAAVVARAAPGTRLPVTPAVAPPDTGRGAALVLAHGVVLVRTAIDAPDGARATASAFGRVLTPVDMLAAFPATVAVTVAPPAALPIGAPADTACTVAGGPAPPLLPAVLERPPADTFPFGAAVGITWEDAVRIAQPGAPAAIPALVAHTGPTTIEEAGAGVLVVDGDLLLRAGAVHTGLITARGIVVFEAGARVHGAVRAHTVIADGAARIEWDACAAEAALRTAAFQRVYRLTRRWRMPAH